MEARQLEGDLVGLGAAVGEEDGVHVGVAELAELLGQLDRRHVGVAGVAVGEGELAHLLRGDLGQLLASVADGDVPEGREAVDVLACRARR